MRSIHYSRRAGCVLFGAVLAGAVALGGATSALAVTSPSRAPAMFYVPQLTHSTSGAGYTAVDAQPITTFSGSLTVPTVTCPATGARDFFPDVSLSSATTFTQHASFGLAIFCATGKATYSNSFVSVGGASAATTILPGQTLHFSLTTNTTKGTLTATVANPAAHESGSATAAGTNSLTRVVAMTSGTTLSPMPSFTTVHYKALKFDGALLSSLGTLKKFNRYNGTTLQIKTTAINTYGTFSTVFVHT